GRKEKPGAAPKPMKVPKIKAPRAPRAAGGPGLRIRWGWVGSRGLVLAVLAVVLVSLTPSVFGNLGGVANDVANVAGNVASQVTSTISEKIASTQTTPGLQRAPFDLPPLSAYAAAF